MKTRNRIDVEPCLTQAISNIYSCMHEKNSSSHLGLYLQYNFTFDIVYLSEFGIQTIYSCCYKE